MMVFTSKSTLHDNRRGITSSLCFSLVLAWGGVAWGAVAWGQDASESGAVPDCAAAVGDPYASRRMPARQEYLKKYGGDQASEAAVAAALQWIADHQLPDGSWSFDHRIGPVVNDRPRTSDRPGTLAAAHHAATSMALLPFLGSGQTHNQGDYQPTVQAGLDYLRKNISPDGSFRESGGTMYSHGLATLALCEAYGMTRDPALRTPAQAALDFTMQAQDPEGGGWRYVPRQPGDTSVLGWQFLSLHRGRLCGLQVTPESMVGIRQFLDSVQYEDGAYYGYTSPARRPATTAIGLLCRMHLGWDREHEALKDGVAWISSQGPSTSGNANMYYNYYATQLVRLYGGPIWQEWNQEMRDFLLEAQDKDGPAGGSWAFAGLFFGPDRGGRLYHTSLATMVLQVYYSHPTLNLDD